MATLTEPLQAGVFGLQALLALTVIESVRRRSLAATLNTLLALLVALLPALIELQLRAAGRPVTFSPALTFWIAAAGVVHSVGILGRYESIWWWDHLAHAVSAGLLAALVYAGLIVTAVPALEILNSPELVRVGTVLVVMVAGASWEALELIARTVADRYGIEPVLIHYGWRDTAYDLVFDFAGALAVVLFDLQVFVPITEQAPTLVGHVIVWFTATMLVGTVLFLLWVAVVALRDGVPA